MRAGFTTILRQSNQQPRTAKTKKPSQIKWKVIRILLIFFDIKEIVLKEFVPAVKDVFNHF